MRSRCWVSLEAHTHANYNRIDEPTNVLCGTSHVDFLYGYGFLRKYLPKYIHFSQGRGEMNIWRWWRVRASGMRSALLNVLWLVLRFLNNKYIGLNRGIFSVLKILSKIGLRLGKGRKANFTILLISFKNPAVLEKNLHILGPCYIKNKSSKSWMKNFLLIQPTQFSIVVSEAHVFVHTIPLIFHFFLHAFLKFHFFCSSLVGAF